MKVISAATMRALDALAIGRGIPGEVLMERAGAGAFAEMVSFLDARLDSRHRQRYAVLAGKGNNGGDGYVVARCLAEAGLPVALYAVCPPEELEGDARTHALRAAETVPVRVVGQFPAEARAPGTVLVDALLGTGISGALRAPYGALVTGINDSGLPVVSLDIPSGLNGDSGDIAGAAVTADLTVTMALPKQGMLTETGLRHCGCLRCVDIGFPPDLVAAASGAGEAVFAADVAPLLGRRPHDGHKGTFGHVLVVGGSRLYGGAPVLAGLGGLRSGAGLCTVAMPESAPAFATGAASLIVRRLPAGGDGGLCAASAAALEDLQTGKQALVFGPGIGPGDGALPVLEQMVRSGIPLVIDADGLRLLARHPATLDSISATTILTPHPGEMRALASGFGVGAGDASDRRGQASALARASGAIVVLKGAGTVLASPEGDTAVNTSGCCALASGGTGDVLAGLLGGLTAQGLPPWDAVRLGVFVHGLAGELTASGVRAFTADELAGRLGPAFRALSPFA